MSGLLKLPGTGAWKGGLGYTSLDTPFKEQTVSAGGIAEQQVELGDLTNDEFFDEVARIRDGIRTLEGSIDTLQTKQQASLPAPSDALSNELAKLSSGLSASLAGYRARIAALGADVEGEAKRAHWEGLKNALQRAGEKWQRVERAQRDRVREKIGRQMRIVNPDVTDGEIQQAFETSGSGPPKIFQQALIGSRTAAAAAALSEAQSRRSELVQIEETLVELAAIMQQVSDLVVVQDAKFATLESTSAGIEADLEQGVKQVTYAKASAAAARHKRKLCAAFGLVLLIVLIVVITVEVRGAGSAGASEPKTETVKASGTITHTAKETAAKTATSVAAAVSSADKPTW
ncbi:hypothetical protein JCM3770_005511 [Rhodotorula araucariae]